MPNQAFRNIFYAQSGGVTAVINASAQGVIETARLYPDTINTVYAGHNGILGALKEALIDTQTLSNADLKKLNHTPGATFGSCRYQLPNIEIDPRPYDRILAVFKAHQIGYFFYNGGGDSQDTANKIAQYSQKKGTPVICIGIPKTIDNDLPYTDNCPGFASVAKYVATSVLEVSFDLVSMAETSTKVFILEVMGRHTGWIAAASALASEKDAPHIILFPEIAFDPKAFLKKVSRTVAQTGYCIIVVSEGVRDLDGKFLSEHKVQDSFGHVQLGGVAPRLATLIQTELNLKYHWAVADYLQRSARHLASKVDLQHAYTLGKAAVELAIAGHNAVMPYIKRITDQPYRWKIDTVPLENVANVERVLPRNFISNDGMHVTAAARNYLKPLIQGECPPFFEAGLPSYARFKKIFVKKKLPEYLITF